MNKNLTIVFSFLLFFETQTSGTELPEMDTTQLQSLDLKERIQEANILLQECDELAKLAVLTEYPTYTALREITRQAGFDPYHHALELAGVRLRYIQTGQKYLLSQCITLEDKVEYCLGQNSYLRETLHVAEEKKSNNFSLKSIMRLLNIHEAEIRDILTIKEFADIQPQEIIVASFLKLFDAALLQWRYFHQSLLNLKDSDVEIIGVKQLLRDATIASHFADLDHSNRDARYTHDHIFFIRSLVDSLTFYLYCHDELSEEDQNTTELFIYSSLKSIPRPNESTSHARNFSKKEKKIRKHIKQIKLPGNNGKFPYPLRRRLMDTVTKGFHSRSEDYRLGEWLTESILNENLSHRIHLTFQSMSNTVVDMNHESEERHETEDTEELVVSESDDRDGRPNEDNRDLHRTEEEIKASYLNEMRTTSHTYRCKSMLEGSDPQGQMNKRALQYFLHPTNPIFLEYADYEQKLQEDPLRAKTINQRIKFDIKLIEERAERRVARVEERQMHIKETAKRKAENASSFLPIHLRNGSFQKKTSDRNRKEPNGHIEKKKNGSRLPISSPVFSPLNGKHQSELITPPQSYIGVELIGDSHPQLDELLLYRKIWSLERQRDYLSWTDLKMNLMSYGWVIRNIDSSFCLLYPPEWIKCFLVKGEGVPALQRVGFMLHYPVNEMIKPIPMEAIDFIRIIFNRDLGLSLNVVDTLIEQQKHTN